MHIANRTSITSSHVKSIYKSFKNKRVNYKVVCRDAWGTLPANFNHIKRVFVSNVAKVWYSCEKEVAVLLYCRFISTKSCCTLISDAPQD